MFLTLALVSKNIGHKNKSTTLNTYYKCKNDYEDNLAIQNEIFKIKYMISTLAVSKWKLCLHNVLKEVDGNIKLVANAGKEYMFDKGT